jgi:signal transduction histidine kinase
MTRDPARRATRLSALFLAAILIPGGFLAYFSIRNIGSQKELAEKRLLDEEGILTEQLGRFLYNELLRCATAFFAAADHAYPDLRKIRLAPDDKAYVAQPFALDGSGRFLWPRYEKTDAAHDESPESARYSTAYAQAQKAEFVAKDPDEAARLYREAAKAAEHAARRAHAINGLARVLTKSNKAEQAADQYEILLERYGAFNDDNGIHFARYALHQLTRISAPGPGAAARRISALLSRLESGETPFSSQTERLLQEVEEWLDSNPEIASLNDLMRGQISFLRNQLTFVARNAQTAALLRPNHPVSPPPLRLGPFEALAERDRGGDRLFVIRRDATRSEILGFQADIESLRRSLLEQSSRMPASVALDVNLAPDDKAYPVDDSPALVRELSPLLPGWRVMVRPHDPEIISRYVTRQRWVYGATLALLVAGMVLGVVLVLRDLSRERRLSQLRTDFVANITHELKTPLTSIRMFAETLRMGRIKDAAERQECLDIIVGETQRLSRLISTVLDFSKIERGEKRYRTDEIDVSGVAESTLNTMKYSLAEQGFKLEAQIEPGARAVGDADALEQAMLNLIQNAVKYSDRDKSVRVELWSQEERVFFRVTDKGIGIPEQERSRIFEKFYRVHAGTERDTGGAGLGLTVVKHIVEAHGGTIEVESKVGEGSSFTISLPGLAGKPADKAGKS